LLAGTKPRERGHRESGTTRMYSNPEEYSEEIAQGLSEKSLEVIGHLMELAEELDEALTEEGKEFTLALFANTGSIILLFTVFSCIVYSFRWFFYH
jgi:hypothetical protein